MCVIICIFLYFCSIFSIEAEKEEQREKRRQQKQQQKEKQYQTQQEKILKKYEEFKKNKQLKEREEEIARREEELAQQERNINNNNNNLLPESRGPSAAPSEYSENDSEYVENDNNKNKQTSTFHRQARDILRTNKEEDMAIDQLVQLEVQYIKDIDKFDLYIQQMATGKEKFQSENNLQIKVSSPINAAGAVGGSVQLGGAGNGSSVIKSSKLGQGDISGSGQALQGSNVSNSGGNGSGGVQVKFFVCFILFILAQKHNTLTGLVCFCLSFLFCLFTG